MRRIIRRCAVALCMLILVVSETATSFAGSGTHITFSGHMAGTKGNVAYYAVGYCGGPVYRYNMKTGKSKKIASGHWMWLNARGKYLYLTKNRYGAEDGSDFYIYRMKTNGKGKKKLAAGKNPIVKGNYIYYIGTKKFKENGRTQDTGETTGIYRMKLNGKGKTRLLKASGYDQYSNLGVTSNGLVFMKNNQWYRCSLNGKNVKQIEEYQYTSNLNISAQPSGYGFSLDFAVARSRYEYFPVESTIVRSGKKNGNNVTTVKGTPCKIEFSGKQMLVISEMDYGEKLHIYIMKPNGKSKKKVRTTYSGGMWDLTMW